MFAQFDDVYDALDKLEKATDYEDVYDNILEIVDILITYGRSVFHIEPASIWDELDL